MSAVLTAIRITGLGIQFFIGKLLETPLQQLSGKFKEWIQHEYLSFPAMVNYWGRSNN